MALVAPDSAVSVLIDDTLVHEDATTQIVEALEVDENIVSTNEKTGADLSQGPGGTTIYNDYPGYETERLRFQFTLNDYTSTNSWDVFYLIKRNSKLFRYYETYSVAEMHIENVQHHNWLSLNECVFFSYIRDPLVKKQLPDLSYGEADARMTDFFFARVQKPFNWKVPIPTNWFHTIDGFDRRRNSSGMIGARTLLPSDTNRLTLTITATVLFKVPTLVLPSVYNSNYCSVPYGWTSFRLLLEDFGNYSIIATLATSGNNTLPTITDYSKVFFNETLYIEGNVEEPAGETLIIYPFKARFNGGYIITRVVDDITYFDIIGSTSAFDRYNLSMQADESRALDVPIEPDTPPFWYDTTIDSFVTDIC